MKKIFLFIFVFASLAVLTGCLKTYEEEGYFMNVKYTGRVCIVEKEGTTPVGGASITLTDGTTIVNRTNSDANGIFEIDVDILNICTLNNNEKCRFYFLFDNGKYHVTRNLLDNTSKVIDLGDVAIFDAYRAELIAQEAAAAEQLPTFNFSGKTYHIYPAMEPMNWKDANNACNNLTYGGHQWFLPTREQALAMVAAHRELFNTSATYWTSTNYDSYKHYYLYYYNMSYWLADAMDNNDKEKFVIPISWW